MAKEKLILDLNKKKKKKFNTLIALLAVIGQESLDIISHAASKKVICGAKDGGKTYIVLCFLILCMEIDPMFNGLSLRKYKGGANNRLGDDLNNTYSRLVYKQYDFKYEYEKSQGYFRRLKNKKTNKSANQRIEFGSFEDLGNIAGIGPSNGGYIGAVHIEEPSEIGDFDDETVTRETWDKQLNIINDSVKRHHRTYAQLDPKYPPRPFCMYITMNDWDAEHPESIDLEYAIPQNTWLEFILGIHPDELSWENVGEEWTIMHNKDIVDPIWHKMKKSLLKNHTKAVYSEFDTRKGLNKRIDTLYVRKSKFGNPSLIADKKVMEEVYREIYNALLMGDKHELARLLGSTDEAVDDRPFAHRFMELKKNIDTESLLFSPDTNNRRKKMDTFVIGVDVDVNRRLVLSPITMSADIVTLPMERPFWENKKIMIHPQIEIPAYGKGTNGENLKTYEQHLKEGVLMLYDKYVTKTAHRFKPTKIGLIVDEVQGGMVGNLKSIFKPLFPIYRYSRRNGDWDIPNRQKFWQWGLDAGDIIIDQENTELIETLLTIKKAGAKDQRVEKGKFEKHMDVVNAAEAGCLLFREYILD